MTNRREFLSIALSASALNAAKYTHIQERIAKRNFEGLTRDDLPTPSMILDIDAFERNVQRMADHSRATGLELRAHVKIHKSVDVSKRQIAAGARGVCCATVAECELMAAAGIPNILQTAQPAGREKIARAIALARKHPSFTCVTDDLAVARQLEEAAAAEKVKLNMLVDVFAGLTRQGCQPGETALKIGQFIDNAPHLKLQGLMAYSGDASHTKTFEARKKKSAGDLAGMLASTELFRKSGLTAAIRSGGSTGTYNIDVGSLTELQAGSYIFMDTSYRKIGGKSRDDIYEDFEPALTVLTTVVSKTRPGVCSIDAGNKATLRPSDQVKGRPDVIVENQGAEYGMLLWKDSGFEVGQRVELYPTNLDTSTNAFDRYYVERGGKIVDAWPIMGRAGAVQR
jgi:D-serine deaminase-like pyridoxal phosphate-dependent protein